MILVASGLSGPASTVRSSHLDLALLMVVAAVANDTSGASPAFVVVAPRQMDLARTASHSIPLALVVRAHLALAAVVAVLRFLPYNLAAYSIYFITTLLIMRNSINVQPSLFGQAYHN